MCLLLHSYVPSRDSLITLLFFFNDTATPEIYTLSLHDALPISSQHRSRSRDASRLAHHTSGWNHQRSWANREASRDRKSTRLNSSHTVISYAVFCLKKKKKEKKYKIHR